MIREFVLLSHPNDQKLYCANPLIIPAFSMAPLMAMEPSLVAGTVARLPLNEPIGVRTALTMTTSCEQELKNLNVQCKLFHCKADGEFKFL